jgi:structural maintenance of chromosome 4
VRSAIRCDINIIIVLISIWKSNRVSLSLFSSYSPSLSNTNTKMFKNKIKNDKSFSSVVGPNGSGKSNVIDAMMFVFGKRAKQLRLNKVSELIHKSTNFRNLEYARVEVHFHEILDSETDAEGFTAVPNSDFTISREAYINNTSKYFVNNKTSNFTEVTNMLKGKGVDLNNNRFLILQGEVEQISMMKPKGVNPGDEGLLEYMEDIIGTNQYVEPIEEAGKKLEELNDKRAGMVSRLTLVEKEKDALEIVKNEAELFLQKEKDLIKAKSISLQMEIAENRKVMTELSDNCVRLRAQLEEEKSKQSEHKCSLKVVEEKYKTQTTELSEIQRNLDISVKEFAEFESKDVKFREDLKHMKQQVKKLDEKLIKEIAQKEKIDVECESIEKDVPALEARKAELESRVQGEESKLDEMLNGLKGEMTDIGAKIDSVERDLQPWEGKIADARGEVDVATAERKLMLEKHAEVEKNLKSAIDGKASAEAKVKSLTKQIADDEAQLEIELANAEKARNAETAAKTKEANLLELTREARGKLEQRKTSASQETQKGAIVQALLDAQSSGGVKGVIGRLGDLGAIDKKYDIAVSTAVGALDYVVVETTSDAQNCVQYLRRNNLGVATFLILEKQAHLAEKLYENQNNIPENAPRLIDLIKPAEERFLPAFYFAVRETAVAEDLDQAGRIAYGAKRHRVVTLKGQVIETSGTMSGGGSKPISGRMRVGKEKPVVIDEKAAAKEVEESEKELQKATGDLERAKKAAFEALREARDAEAKCAQFERTLPKLKAELEAAESKIADLNGRLDELKAAHEASKNDASQLKELDAKVSEAEDALKSVLDGASRLKAELKKWQVALENVGGEELRRQKSVVREIHTGIEMASQKVTDKRAAAKSHVKTLERLTKSVSEAESEKEKIKNEMDTIKEEFKGLEEGAMKVLESQKELKDRGEAKSKECSESQVELDSIMKIVNELRSIEVDIQGKIDDIDNKLRDHSKMEKGCLKEMEKLQKERNSLSPGVDESEILLNVSDEELGEIDEEKNNASIVAIETELKEMKPDMSSIEQFALKLTEYEERVGDLKTVTEERDSFRQTFDDLRKKRLEEFMAGFSIISIKLKEMYQMITLGGDAELELVDSLDPFSEGIVFSVRPPKKSWKNIANLSGGEKTLSSLALVFALHHYKPTPLYVMDEIDAALDFKNVSIVGHYIKERTKDAQFIIISLRNNMFELADRLVGVYKTENHTKTVAINPGAFTVGSKQKESAAPKVEVLGSNAAVAKSA